MSRRPIDQEPDRSLPAKGEPHSDGRPAPSSEATLEEIVQLLHGRASGWRRLLPWTFGLLALPVLILVVLHFSSIERFIQLVQAARPEWLFLACIAQVGTYVCAAVVWRQVLQHAGHPLPLRALVPLGVAKLYMDQAVPSAGVSGTLLVVRGLTRRRVPPKVAMAALLVGLVSFYTAYLTVVVISVGIFWRYHRANLAFSAVAAILVATTVAIPAAVLWLRWWGDRSPPTWLRGFPRTAILLRALAEAPTGLLRNPRLLAEAVAFQLGIFFLDALTLWLALHALGETSEFSVVFASFVTASMAATIGPIPLGLGTFEAGSVGTLSLFGVPIEAALAGTLLLRGLTFWLPMLPGLWLTRREIGQL